jgi:hypothetical protein
MAWTQRGRKRYYYRCRRVDGRPVQQYIGTGPVGEAAALADAHRRVDREIQARAQRRGQAQLAAVLAPLTGLTAATKLVSRAALLAAGFYQHDRGEWRLRKHVPDSPSPTSP